MQYTLRRDEVSSILVLSISEDVDYPAFFRAAAEAERLLALDNRYSLLIDGNKIERFNIPNHICQQMAPKLFSRERKVAFFSAAPLAFGMARVIQTYSFNENFVVFKTQTEALKYLVREPDSGTLDTTHSPERSKIDSSPL